MPPAHAIKKKLIDLGPGHPLLRLALALYGRARGVRVRFGGGKIAIRKGGRVILLSQSHYPFSPYLIRMFDYYTGIIAGDRQVGRLVYDFSGPRSHRYLKTGVELLFPNVPDDDAMSAYTSHFDIGEGMTVVDAGAHAGLTTYFFSHLVGRTGRVYSLEPDDTSRQFLKKNVALHSLDNVCVFGEALGPRTGRAAFNMDGTLSAGLAEYLAYPDTGRNRAVDTLSIEDLCTRIGRTPDFIKMDIEGAELGVIEASLGFLKGHAVHFAIDSCHPCAEGPSTSRGLERLFGSIGYQAWTSRESGFITTWAGPARW